MHAISEARPIEPFELSLAETELAIIAVSCYVFTASPQAALNMQTLERLHAPSDVHFLAAGVDELCTFVQTGKATKDKLVFHYQMADRQRTIELMASELTFIGVALPSLGEVGIPNALRTSREATFYTPRGQQLAEQAALLRARQIRELHTKLGQIAQANNFCWIDWPTTGP